MDNFFKRTWAEINLDAIRHNYTEIKQSLNPDTKICCVVKADGYGPVSYTHLDVYKRQVLPFILCMLQH